MNTTHTTTLAEAADRRWRLLAVAVFLMALKSAASAGMVVVDQPYLRYLDWFEAAMAIGSLAVVLWLLFFKFFRVPASERRSFLKVESYVGTTIKTAMFRSWLVTFILLSVIAPFAGKHAEIPSQFFLQLTLATMLGVFSGVFFFLNADGGAADVVDA